MASVEPSSLVLLVSVLIHSLICSFLKDARREGWMSRLRDGFETSASDRCRVRLQGEPVLGVLECLDLAPCACYF
jgi:hypothetical protein